MKKLSVWVVAVFIILSMLFAACGSGKKKETAKKTKYNIAVSQQGANNSWAASADAHFKYGFEAYKDKIENLYYAECGYDSQKQIGDIEDLLTKDLDAIIIQATSETALAGVVERVHAQGVKVVIYNGDVGTQAYDSHVTRDQQITGETYAKYVCDRLSGKGNVIVIMGYPGSGYSNAVLAGVQSVVSRNPGIKVLGIEYAEYNPAQSKQIIEGYFTKGEKVDGVIVDGGLMGFGVLEAFTDAGLTIPPTSCDDTMLFLKRAVDLGFTDYVCLSSAAELSAECVSVLFKILEGESYQKNLEFPPESITGQEVLAKLDTKLPESYWYFSRIPQNRIPEFFK